MRRSAALVLVLLAAGCGSSEPRAEKPAKSATEQMPHDSFPVTFRPVAPLGRWVKLQLSPSLKWWLGQWSGECEAQSTYLIPARGGKPRPILSSTGESYALGWKGNQARIELPRATCGGNGDLKPGIYLVDPATLKLTLVRRIKALPGGP